MRMDSEITNVTSRLDNINSSMYINVYSNDVRFITHYWIGVVAKYWLEEGRQVHSLVG